MIRLEIKVVIPDDQEAEEFLRLLLRTASETDYFWQTHFDLFEGQRMSIEAVLGEKGFSFLDANKVLVLTCDIADSKQLPSVTKFFEKFTKSWEIEITKFPGERILGEKLELDIFEEESFEEW